MLERGDLSLARGLSPLAGGAAKDTAETFHRVEQIDAERFVVEEVIEVERKTMGPALYTSSLSRYTNAHPRGCWHRR